MQYVLFLSASLKHAVIVINEEFNPILKKMFFCLKDFFTFNLGKPLFG